MKKNISMVDQAYQILINQKDPCNFFDLYNQVAIDLEMSPEEKEEKLSLFYTNITLDGRLITVGENNWDLRERHRFDEVHIDMNDIYNEDDDEEVEESDDVDADSTIEDDYS